MDCHLGTTANKAEARPFLVFPGTIIEFVSASKYSKQVAGMMNPTGKDVAYDPVIVSQSLHDIHS